MIEVHSSAHHKRFYASQCSLGSCACVVIWILIIVLPLVIGLITDGFWIKDLQVYQQPDLRFQQKMLIYMQGMRYDSSGTAHPMELAWTTSAAINQRLGSNARAAHIQASKDDFNMDDVPDAWYISASMPLQNNEQIYSATMYSFFDVEFHDTPRMRMDGMLTAQATSGIPGSSAHIAGSVEFTQKQQLSGNGGLYLPYQGVDLVELSADTPTEFIRPEGLSTAYARRNLTIHLKPAAGVAWRGETTYDPRNGDATAGLSSSNRFFTISMETRTAPVPMWIRPGVAYVLKWAWVQYIALYVIGFFFLNILKRALFEGRLIQARRIDDIPVNLKKKFA